MYKKSFFIIALAVSIFACNKSTSPSTPNCVNTGIPSATEIATLKTYLTNNSISATFDSSGFFYQVLAPGSGVTPVSSSTVTVTYVGKFLNGTVFDSSKTAAGISYPLSGFIAGWQLGIPLIKKGGSINLYIPPSLAYGCNDYGSIPGNSNLIFNIQLLDVQ